MNRVNNIINDKAFRAELLRINEYEKERIYCRHGINHLMDVARIAYIHALEKPYEIDKEIIYAAALLHDIGRGVQYETGEEHDVAGIRIAGDILSRSGFTDNECRLILAAAAGHRGYTDNKCSGSKSDKEIMNANIFSGDLEAAAEEFASLIKNADNESRQCFMCNASDTCKWSDSRKNHRLII